MSRTPQDQEPSIGPQAPVAPRPAPQRLLLLLGSLGPLGRLPASGTVTVALVGVPLFRMMAGGSRAMWLVALVLLGAASVWVHHVGDRLLGEKDSGTLVWDEVFGYLVAVAMLPWSWRLAAFAFVLERAIDIVKVPPANVIERRWPGGWGVVGDDLVAGLYTRLVLAGILALRPEWLSAAM